jgi:hypothetical protein
MHFGGLYLNSVNLRVYITGILHLIRSTMQTLHTQDAILRSRAGRFLIRAVVRGTGVEAP